MFLVGQKAAVERGDGGIRKSVLDFLGRELDAANPCFGGSNEIKLFSDLNERQINSIFRAGYLVGY
jgi:hypothetical protein